jgi:hypothetical protein
VDAVRMLVTDPVRRAEYAARARKYAMLRHSIHNAQSLAQLIDSGAIGSPSAASMTQAGQSQAAH